MRLVEPTFSGVPVEHVYCLVPVRLAGMEIVVFVDGRRLCQNISAVHLQSPRVKLSAIVDALDIVVNVVPGYKLHLKGGAAIQDSLVFTHGEVVVLDLIPEERETGAAPSLPGSEDDPASDESEDTHDAEYGDGPEGGSRTGRSRSPRRNFEPSREYLSGQQHGDDHRGQQTQGSRHFLARTWIGALSFWIASDRAQPISFQHNLPRYTALAALGAQTAPPRHTRNRAYICRSACLQGRRGDTSVLEGSMEEDGDAYVSLAGSAISSSGGSSTWHSDFACISELDGQSCVKNEVVGTSLSAGSCLRSLAFLAG